MDYIAMGDICGPQINLRDSTQESNKKIVYKSIKEMFKKKKKHQSY